MGLSTSIPNLSNSKKENIPKNENKAFPLEVISVGNFLQKDKIKRYKEKELNPPWKLLFIFIILKYLLSNNNNWVIIG